MTISTAGRTRSSGPVAGTTQRLPRIRKIIADRMSSSLQSTAQLTAVQEVDVTELVELRAANKARFLKSEGFGLTYLPFFAKALVEAAQEFPQFNASIDLSAGEVTYHAEVNLGIAVDTPRGLMVPVIRSAQDMSVVEIARQISDLAGRTKAGTISPDELAGSTISLSNIGGAGSLTDTPIINYPEVAILATGAIVKRPRVVTSDGNDTVAIRSVCSLPLTYDHRLVDGADAGRFLTFVKNRVQAADFAAELSD